MLKAGVILLLIATACFALPFVAKGLGYGESVRGLWALPLMAIPLTAGAGALIGAWLWKGRSGGATTGGATIRWLVQIILWLLVATFAFFTASKTGGRTSTNLQLVTGFLALAASAVSFVGLWNSRRPRV